MWDKQGVLRGACSCGDCQEFMAGNAVRCDYCDCSPARHSKIHILSADQRSTDFSQVTFKTFPEPPENLKSLRVSETSQKQNGISEDSSTPSPLNEGLIDNEESITKTEPEKENEDENIFLLKQQSQYKTLDDSISDKCVSENDIDATAETKDGTLKIKSRKRQRSKASRKNNPGCALEDAVNQLEGLDSIAASSPKKKRGRPPKSALLAKTNQPLNNSLSSHIEKKPIDSELHKESNTEKELSTGSKCDIWRIDLKQLSAPETSDIIDDETTSICNTQTAVIPANNEGQCSVVEVNENVFQCTECNLKFKFRKSAFNHIMYMHCKKYRYACINCNLLFRTKSQASKHVRISKDTPLQTCTDVIETNNATHTDLSKDPVNHLDTSTNDSEEVDLEDYDTEDIEHQNEFELSSDPQTNLEASDNCDKKDISKASELMKPKPDEHKKTRKRKPAAAKGKGKVEKQKSSYDVDDKDVSTKESDETFGEFRENHGKCPNCPKVFKTAKSFNRHQVNFHSDREFSCQYCGKTYRRKHDLVIHERFHTGARPFECRSCDMSFRSKNNLQSHQAVHDMRGAFQCQFCGRRFDSKHGMLHHERSHTGEKPYECQTCGKRFAHRCVLITHERVHTGEKPFVCTYCSRGFKDQSTLRKHVRIHTLEKPYKCSYCDRAFNQKWYVKVHEKCHTGETGASKEKEPRKDKSKAMKAVEASTLKPNENMSIVNPTEAGNTIKPPPNKVPTTKLPEQTIGQPVAPVASIATVPNPPAVGQYMNPSNIALTIPQVNLMHSSNTNSAPALKNQVLATNSQIHAAAGEYRDHIRIPNMSIPTMPPNNSVSQPRVGVIGPNIEPAPNRFFGNAASSISLPGLGPTPAGAHLEPFAVGTATVTHGTGAAGVVAGPSALPSNPHSMLEVMSQSLESLEQHYNVAQRLYSGYINSMSMQGGGGSAAGAQTEQAPCAGHVPY